MNPQLVNSVTGAFYPVAPGDQPYLAVRVINDTTANIKLDIVWDDGVSANNRYSIHGGAQEATADDTTGVSAGLTPEGRDSGILLDWPVLQLGIGSLTNPIEATISANIPPDMDAIKVPFNHRALQAGVDYNRGDTVIFHLNEDTRSTAFITVTISRIAAFTDIRPFARANPFETHRYLVDLFNTGQLVTTFGGLP